MAASQIKIETGIPIPPRAHVSGRPAKYPFRDMKPGDSFFVPLDKPDAKRCMKLRNTLSICGRRALGKGRVATRTAPDHSGVRVWRLAEPAVRRVA